MPKHRINRCAHKPPLPVLIKFAPRRQSAPMATTPASIAQWGGNVYEWNADHGRWDFLAKTTKATQESKRTAPVSLGMIPRPATGARLGMILRRARRAPRHGDGNTVKSGATLRLRRTIGVTLRLQRTMGGRKSLNARRSLSL